MINFLIYKLFGFKVDETDYYTRYVRDDESGFTHIIDILHKQSGKHIIQSYSYEDTTTEGSLCVGIPITMMPLLALKSACIWIKWKVRKQ